MEPKKIVNTACAALKRNYGYNVRCTSVKIKKLSSASVGTELSAVIELSFRKGIHGCNHQISCKLSKFEDPMEAYTLPFVSNLIAPETFNRLKDDDKIIICFAAWIFKVGKHYKYF